MKRLFFFLAMCAVLSLQAQKQTRYERLSTASGLSQSSVYKIIQDKQGFLWFATGDGLNRYDGHNFKIYRNDPSDPTTLSGSEIFTVAQDDEGNLWVGTRNSGLNKIELATGKITRFSKGPTGQDLSNSNIPSILNIGKGRMGVAVLGLGYLVYDIRTNQLISAESEWKNTIVKEVVRLFKHSSGTVWMGTRTGFLVSQLNAHSFIPYQFGANNNRVRALFETKNGDILVGTDGRGIYRFTPKTQQFKVVFYQASDPLSRQNIVTSIAKDALQNLWIGTDNGVYKLNGEDFKSYTNIPSNPDPELGLSSNSVMSLFTDANQNTWVGTWEAGLNISFFQKPRFAVLRYKPNTLQGLLSNKVSTLLADGDQGVWVGSNVGLSYFNHKSGQVTHYLQSASSNKLNSTETYDVNFIHPSGDGGVWVGLWGKGINLFTKERQLKDYPFKPGVREANFNTLENFNSEFLLGTQGMGVVAFNPMTKQYRVPFAELGKKNFLNKSIAAIRVLNGKEIWVGTVGFGLYVFDVSNRKLRHYVKSAEIGALSYNHVNKIYQDRQKRIWVMTQGGGLNQYLGAGKGFKVFTVNNGLGSNSLRGMVEDAKGDMWFSTNGGISKMDGKTLKFVNFEEADGLQGKEFMTNAVAKNSQNWLFFGGVNGLNYMKSDSLRMRLDVPPVYFTKLKIFNKEVEAGEDNSPLRVDILSTKHLVLRPNQSVFSLDFVALEYQRPKNNRYAYYLEGFENEWNVVGTQRTVTYTNLSPGDYIFKVKASNSDGIWAEKPYELKITVLPPWYRTWWAYVLYVVLLAAVIYAFIREVQVREAFRTDLRLKEIEKERIQELEQVKTHFFTNISHELRTPLTLITSPLEKYFLSNASLNKDQKTKINSIYQNAQKLLRLINQLLDLSKIESGNVQPVVEKHDLVRQLHSIKQSFDAYAQQKQIKLKWDAPVESLFVYYDADIIEKCVTNLLSNAFKFTPEDGIIGIRLELHKVYKGASESINRVSIHVSDTGKGISAEHRQHIFDRFYQIPEKVDRVGTGVGLSLCKELIEVHRGSIEVQSDLGAGSDFKIQFPVTLEAFDPAWVKSGSKEVKELQSQLVDSAQVIQQEKQILLIVEDHAEMRAFIREIFEGTFQVIEADRGETGLEMALTYLPDVVITDWMMPGMSGVNLCKQIRKNAKTSHIPVVILTSKSSQESQIEGMQSGADDFISKPFHADILELRVAKLLEAKERLRKSWQDSVLNQDLQQAFVFEDEFLSKATQVVIEHLEEADFDVEHLEQAMDMSKMQLYRKLKMLTSLAGNEFIRSIRLQQARLLLEKGSLNVSEVAYQVGFNDPAYFTRAFKKQYGHSPKTFISKK
ncbi:hybrid sensor histidine kinase/response regulator transcription factor [Aquirufa antheringensis]|uniref:hybrid sensor histidine kinase/response regulator transcription factor n=1 Tax=Aquirufa antheringensis TaxID=2516559 RepID=UPI001032A1CF|nr:two-component regulator propeller domain-containing protein [Aquirufa antheringensis]TBH70108.1 hybrid sensor histidine kinase/response regulator [Aquirufa antheringensis]